jgi:hypothetical protein
MTKYEVYNHCMMLELLCIKMLTIVHLHLHLSHLADALIQNDLQIVSWDSVCFIQPESYKLWVAD